MPQMLAFSFWNVVRTSPTLPPSAIRTSAMRGMLPGAYQDYADIVEDRGDRRVRLVNGDLDGADARKRGQDGVGDGTGGAFQQFVIGVSEGCRRGRDHIGIGNGIGETIGARGFRQIGGEFEIDHETLTHLGLMFHDAVAGMDDDACNEDRIGHPWPSIAAAPRKACTVSDTSWVRMIR